MQNKRKIKTNSGKSANKEQHNLVTKTNDLIYQKLPNWNVVVVENHTNLKAFNHSSLQQKTSLTAFLLTNYERNLGKMQCMKKQLLVFIYLLKVFEIFIACLSFCILLKCSHYGALMDINICSKIYFYVCIKPKHILKNVSNNCLESWEMVTDSRRKIDLMFPKDI